MLNAAEKKSLSIEITRLASLLGAVTGDTTAIEAELDFWVELERADARVAAPSKEGVRFAEGLRAVFGL